MFAVLFSVFLTFSSAADLEPIKPNPNKSSEGYVMVNGHRIWTEYKAPQAGQPLIINLNGLTYSTEQWRHLNKELNTEMPKAGILTWDMQQQGRSLAAIPNAGAFYEEFTEVSRALGELTKIRTPMDHWERWITGEYLADYFEWSSLTFRLYSLMMDMAGTNPAFETHYSQDTEDLKELIRMFRGNSKVHITGLSYGGAIALDYMSKHGQTVESAVVMAPFMKSLPEQDSWIRVQMQIFRLSYPWILIEDAKLYDFFLRVLVFATYPSAEPVIMENYLKLEATYRKAQGSKDFNAYDLADRLPTNGKVHLVAGIQDEYVKKPTIDELWEAMPKRSRGSYTAINGTGHKIVEAIPEYISKVITDIVSGVKKYSSGKTLYGDAKKNKQPTVVKKSTFDKLTASTNKFEIKDAETLMLNLLTPDPGSVVACNKVFSR